MIATSVAISSPFREDLHKIQPGFDVVDVDENSVARQATDKTIVNAVGETGRIVTPVTDEIACHVQSL
jgi:hypothetical protein